MAVSLSTFYGFIGSWNKRLSQSGLKKRWNTLPFLNFFFIFNLFKNTSGCLWGPKMYHGCPHSLPFIFSWWVGFVLYLKADGWFPQWIFFLYVCPPPPRNQMMRVTLRRVDIDRSKLIYSPNSTINYENLYWTSSVIMHAPVAIIYFSSGICLYNLIKGGVIFVGTSFVLSE